MKTKGTTGRQQYSHQSLGRNLAQDSHLSSGQGQSFTKKYNKNSMMVAVLFWGSGLFLVLALLTHHTEDPSWNFWGSSLPGGIHNACGRVGSFLSDGLFQILGWGAWVLPLSLVLRGGQLWRGEKKKEKFFLVFLRSLLHLTLLCTLMSFSLASPQRGGVLGSGIRAFLIAFLNPLGAKILVWSLGIALGLGEGMRWQETLTDWVKIGRGKIRGINILWLKVQGRLSEGILVQRTSPPPPVVPSPSLDGDLQASPTTHPASVKDQPSNSPPSTIGSGEDPMGRTPSGPLPPRVWKFPSLEILSALPSRRFQAEEKEVHRKMDLLKDKLAQFQITGEIVEVRSGPAVTLFEFRPDSHVKLSKITELEDDLALALSSESLRILAPIPGRDVVGIETSNRDRDVVYLRELLEGFSDSKSPDLDLHLPLPLGKDISGQSKWVDLRRLPHLLVAGTTGSGKSVFVVSALSALVFRHSPETLRLLIIDPKQVDLVAFESLPHLILPVVTDVKKAVASLRWAVQEMERRYTLMGEVSVRNVEAYNEKMRQLSEAAPSGTSGSPLPYLLIVVEEFGDLMVVDKGNVEMLVVRLSQKARACGIHLLLAMQSPRREVVTGLIKTNIPGRISFKVASGMDSRIILDEVGGERLLAQGDMLFKSPGTSTLSRHHGPFFSDQDMESLVRHWSAQAPPQFDPQGLRFYRGTGATAGASGSASVGMGQGGASSPTERGEASGVNPAVSPALEGEPWSEEWTSEWGEPSSGSGGGSFSGEDHSLVDDRYEEILEWTKTLKEVSASLLQRRFQLGYPRAARLIEHLEKRGIVGPAHGSRPRQVIHPMGESHPVVESPNSLSPSAINTNTSLSPVPAPPRGIS